MRACTPFIQVGRAVVIGGVVVKPGEIIMGDRDGVIVIPAECEDDLFEHIDGFVEGNGAFGLVANDALANGVVMTEHPALAKMFAYKYTKPESYWRLYEQWWAENKPECVI